MSSVIVDRPHATRRFPPWRTQLGTLHSSFERVTLDDMSVPRIVCPWLLLFPLACSSVTPAPAETARSARQTPPPASQPSTPEEAPQPSASAASQVHDDDAHSQQGAPHQHHHPQGFHMDFSDVQRFARHFDDPARDAWQKPAEVISLMHLQPGQAVADVGAGTGYFLGYLSRAVGSGGHVLGLDVEPAMVEYMTQRAQQEHWANVEAKTVPYDDPQLPSGQIDRVLIVNTWHHIDARAAYAHKLALSLKPAGAVFIIDFTRESDVGPPPEHRLSPQQVVEELEAGGLAAAILSEDLPKQYVVQAKLKPR